MGIHEFRLRGPLRSRNSGPARRRADEHGASAVEYGLLITGIAAVIAVIVFAFGDNIHDALFDDTCQRLVAERGQGDCV